MESKALRRLRDDIARLMARYRQARERQAQLATALGKNRLEVERLRAEVERYKEERLSTKKQVDALIRRFEELDINWGPVDR